MARVKPSSRAGGCAHHAVDRGIDLWTLGHIAVFVVFLMTNGCATPVSSEQANLFRKKHPQQAQGYIVLGRTSVEYMEYEMEERYREVDAIITGIDKRKDDPIAMAKHMEYLKRCVRRDPRLDLEWQRFKNRLRQDDAIYFFKYRHGQAGGERGLYDDFGILVLRDGDVIYRSRWGWGILQDSGGTNEPPESMTLDKLQK